MATNEQIIERIDRFETNVYTRFDQQDENIKRVETESKGRDCKIETKLDEFDKDLRGNGEIGLKAVVKDNTKRLDKIDKYFTMIMFLIIGEIILRLFGLI